MKYKKYVGVYSSPFCTEFSNKTCCSFNNFLELKKIYVSYIHNLKYGISYECRNLIEKSFCFKCDALYVK